MITHRVVAASLTLLVATSVSPAASAPAEPPTILRMTIDDEFVTQGLCGFPLHVRTTVTADVGKIDVRFTFSEAGEIVSEEVIVSAGQQDGEFLTELCTVLR